MAKRERERYTERARPHRRGSPGGGGGPAGADSWSNPVVLVAAGGLVVAVVLALGFLVGSGGTVPQTTDAPDATPTFPLEIPTTPAEVPDRPPPPDTPQFGAPEDQGLDPEGTAYFATIETPHGPIVFEMWPELAPETVNAFVFLAREGFYDGLTFHRVEPEFVIQGGDPLGTGTGGPGYSVAAEFNADNPVPHRAGTVAMARAADPDSAGSQFYIVTQDSPNASGLDRKYTVFGHVIQGMDAVHAMQVGDAMSKITIEEKPIAERVVSPDDIREGNLPEGVGGEAEE